MEANSARATRPLSRLAQWCRSIDAAEISGAFGDIGTFVPLVVGLTQVIGLDLGTTLIATGLYNIVSGVIFGIPMPVQPMKAIAAVALAQSDLGVPDVAAAGIFVSAVTLFLGITGLINLFNRLVPEPVVCGLQLSVGLNLAVKGFQTVWPTSDQGAEGERWLAYLGAASAIFILLTVYPRPRAAREASSQDALCAGSAQNLESSTAAAERQWRVPAALVVVAAGIVVAVATRPGVIVELRWGPSRPRLVWPRPDQWRRGATPPPAALLQSSHQAHMGFIGPAPPQSSLPLECHKDSSARAARRTPAWLGKESGPAPSAGVAEAGVAQLALTLLNSVVAVAHLGKQLFPDRAPRPALVAASVGAMNLAGAWLGALPCCHGAGGLAAQARFGARTGAAPVILGCVKLTLGLLFGSSLFTLLRAFPAPLLGSLLVFSGIELASSCRGERSDRDMLLILASAGACLAFKNTALGVAIGVLAAALWGAQEATQQCTASLHRRAHGQTEACSASGRGDPLAPSGPPLAESRPGEEP